MDTTGFFRYPGAEIALADDTRGFLADRDAGDWTLLLEHTETRLFRPGEVVLAAGEHDRALYLLLDGRLQAPSGTIDAITTVGEAAFLDGRPRTVSLSAVTSGELARLGFEAYEALAARRPELGRAVLLDLGRLLASRLHATGDRTPGWTG
jgi:CRP-like cAMP-binding protein